MPATVVLPSDRRRLTRDERLGDDRPMPDHVTLDIIDRPAGGAVACMRRLGTLRKQDVVGLRALIRLGTGHFVARTRPSPTARRVGVLTVWEDGAAAEAGWEPLLGALTCGREHWHVRAEVARAAFTEPWIGWSPDTAGAPPLSDDEPALILISGDLRARYVRAFLQDAGTAVGQAFTQRGYLGGLAIQSSPLNTTSCSAWRSYGDAKAYAYRPGRHSEVMRRDRAEERHRTEWFLRLRPLEERGSVGGVTPFHGVLAPPVAA
jgi:hypothetical protein